MLSTLDFDPFGEELSECDVRCGTLIHGRRQIDRFRRRVGWHDVTMAVTRPTTAKGYRVILQMKNFDVVTRIVYGKFDALTFRINGCSERYHEWHHERPSGRELRGDAGCTGKLVQ